MNNNSYPNFQGSTHFQVATQSKLVLAELWRNLVAVQLQLIHQVAQQARQAHQQEVPQQFLQAVALDLREVELLLLPSRVAPHQLRAVVVLLSHTMVNAEGTLLSSTEYI
jgi:hypothetical protein